MRDSMSFQRASWRKASIGMSASSSRLIRLEQVEVEVGGDALRIVIGGDQALDRLHPVHADQQLRPVAEQVAPAAQQVRRACAERNCRSSSRGRSRVWGGRRCRRQIERPGEVGDDRLDRDVGEVARRPRSAFAKIVAGDVDRHIGCGMDRFEEQWRLGRGARAELDDRRAARNARGNRPAGSPRARPSRSASDNRTGSRVISSNSSDPRRS